MAVLADTDRADAIAEYQQLPLSVLGSAHGDYTKADLRGALNGVDDWAEANKASYLAALPTAFSVGSTGSQKARLLYDIAAFYADQDLFTAQTFSPLTPSVIGAAFVAAWTWLSDNQAGFNASIPQPIRTRLSTKQKALLLMHVLKKRFEKDA